MDKKKIARKIFYIFIILNIIWLIYLSFTKNEILNIEIIKTFLSETNLYIGLIIFILILTLRGLTLLPGTPFFNYMNINISKNICNFIYCNSYNFIYYYYI